MSKKIIITSITVKSSTIEETVVKVGEDSGTEHLVVEKIIYEEHGYNKGKQGKFPAYILFFANSNTRMVVKESEVTRVGVEVIENKETIPELPESPVSAPEEVASISPLTDSSFIPEGA